MTVLLSELKVGDVLSYWYDTGAFGYQACFAKVIKIGAKKVRVRTEYGHEAWRYPEWFLRKVTDPELLEEIKWHPAQTAS